MPISASILADGFACGAKPATLVARSPPYFAGLTDSTVIVSLHSALHGHLLAGELRQGRLRALRACGAFCPRPTRTSCRLLRISASGRLVFGHVRCTTHGVGQRSRERLLLRECNNAQHLSVGLPPSYPEPKVLYLPAIKERLPVFEGTFRIAVDAIISASPEWVKSLGANGRGVTIAGQLHYQACRQNQVLSPDLRSSSLAGCGFAARPPAVTGGIRHK